MKEDLPRLVQWAQQHFDVTPPPGSTDSTDYCVSVIIPSHRRIPIGLQAFQDQDCVSEVLILANGDLSLEGEHVLQVPWKGHGRTRQEAVEKTSGDFVLFSVDDALPLGRGCVRELVEALLSGDYDAVTGRQIPWPESDRITQERLLNWTPPGDHHTPFHQVDHVFALYKRSTLLEHPLPDVPIGEDLHWSQNRKVGYVPTAPVVHAHPRKARALYARNKALHIEHCRVGHPPHVPTLSAVLRSLPGVLRAGLRYGPHEIPNHLAEVLGQWRGSVDAKKSS